MSAAQESIEPGGWQQALAEAYQDPAALLRDLDLHGTAAAAGNFAMRVPRGYAARMRRGDPLDPLLLQVLPRQEESRSVPGFSGDPVGDLASLRLPGLLQKYQGRALVISTGACAVHCRYCFRREFPYGAQLTGPEGRREVVAALAADTSIREVILSGGDPLSLTDLRLADWLQALDALPQIRRIRLHTRTAVVLPERVTAGLLDLLGRLRTPVVIVVHCNHANEIDAAVRSAMTGLRDVSAALLNQSVLLRQVNDSVDALVSLSESLFAAGVLPYYLHQLDPVNGAAHFAVSDRRARALVDAAAARLPGYLVPRLVRELAGAAAKLPLQP